MKLRVNDQSPIDESPIEVSDGRKHTVSVVLGEIGVIEGSNTNVFNGNKVVLIVDGKQAQMEISVLWDKNSLKKFDPFLGGLPSDYGISTYTGKQSYIYLY